MSVPAPKVIGVVFMNGGTGGAAEIVRSGTAPCVFDTSASAMIGDYVALSAANNGYCRDVGATYPSGSQPVGIVSALGMSGINYVFVMNDVLALSAGSSGNVTIAGNAGLLATLDIIANPTFATSVTSPLYTSPGTTGLQVTASGGGPLPVDQPGLEQRAHGRNIYHLGEQ